jgi:hypothetical protein
MTFAVYRTKPGIEAIIYACEKVLFLHGSKPASSRSYAVRLSVAEGDGATSVTLNREWANFYSSLGRTLDCPWVYIMLQEKSFWEYTLHQRDEVPDLFSTCPEQWGRPLTENEKWRGSPEVLASLWGVDLPRIERYYLNWDLGPIWVDVLQREELGYRRNGKAYDVDRWPYGCVDQAFDFARALGSVDFSSAVHSYYTVPDDLSRDKT